MNLKKDSIDLYLYFDTRKMIQDEINDNISYLFEHDIHLKNLLIYFKSFM